jgi:hypothetical protein
MVLSTIWGYRLAGATGSAAIAVSGPASGSPFAVGVSFFGITLLVIAWWFAGRAPGGERDSRLTLVIWCAPLLFVPPLFSRDVYSYLAQGALVLSGGDVYQQGVAGTIFADHVPAMWQDTPAPYGPVPVLLSALIVWLTGHGLTAGVLGFRLLALAGLTLIVVVLPRLARQCGADPAAALWLGALNPLVPLHLVAGAHNEAIMIGLLLAGLSLLTGRWRVLGVVLITLAALVKLPALAALLAVRRQAWPVAALTVAATTGLLSAGLGFGWLTALDTPFAKHAWSLTTALGRATALLIAGEPGVTFWIWAGFAAIAVVTALSCWHRHHLGPIRVAGLILLAVALLGPATRPWYVLWGAVLIAATLPTAHPFPTRDNRSIATAGSGGRVVSSDSGATDSAVLMIPGGLARASSASAEGGLARWARWRAALVAWWIGGSGNWARRRAESVPGRRWGGRGLGDAVAWVVTGMAFLTMPDGYGPAGVGQVVAAAIGVSAGLVALSMVDRAARISASVWRSRSGQRPWRDRCHSVRAKERS